MEEFTEDEFMALATFAMCNDQPDQTDCIDINTLNEALNKVASNMSDCSSWISLYMRLGK